MSFIKVWTGAAWKLINTANVFRVFIGAAWKDVTFFRVYELYNGQVGWREVWAITPPAPPLAPVDPPVVLPPVPLTVSIDPPVVYGALRNALGTVTTFYDATISVSGGVGPYIYQWTISTWTASTPPVILTPGAAATRFSQDINIAEGFEQARFKGIVQDSLGNTGSAFVDAEFRTTETGGLQ